MGYSEGKEKYSDKFATGICRALVDEGEFDNIEDCKSEASDKADKLASNWASEAPIAMADYLES